MAKKITDNESGVIETHDLPPEKVEETTPATDPPKVEEEQPAPKVEKEPKVEKIEQEIPEHADRILKSFANYPELYIDFQGGTFTVDTPPAFRSNATLYTNPYHKP